MLLRLFTFISFILIGSPIFAAQPLDSIVAVVNNSVITQSELEAEQSRVKQQIAQNHIKSPSAADLRNQVLDHLINMNLQLQLAKERGLTVSNEQLNQAIISIAKQNHLNLEQFRQKLLTEGIDYAAFRNEIRHQIIISNLQQQEVAQHIKVTDQEINDLVHAMSNQPHQTNEYHIKDILVSLPDNPSPEQIQSAQAKANLLYQKLKAGADFEQTAVAESASDNALKGGDLGWRKPAELPTIFADTLKKLKVGKIAGPLQAPNGFHIIKLVDLRGSHLKHTMTETHVRHILIRPDAITSDNEVKSKLEKMRRQILNGASFAKLAEKYSQDPSSATQGGDLGWVKPHQLTPHFEDVMNKISVKTITEPVRTSFGWHLIQVLGRRITDDTKSYQRSETQKMIYRRKVEEGIFNWIQQLRSQAYLKIIR